MVITGENYREYHLGTKAGNLFFMQENGVNVPSFFCVLGGDTESAEDFAADFFLSSDRVAVRSCAGLEDGENISFAGQFRTELNLSVSEIGAAVSRVGRVPDSPGFQKYCKLHQLEPKATEMSVIVQRMIEAELSGVIFTANPQGILNEAVVVIGRGTGDNVVEDRTDTTTYYYNYSDRLYYREQRGNSPLIDENMLMAVLAQAERIKELFRAKGMDDGPGKDGTAEEFDIEFAIRDNEIFILQARPITTLGKSGFPIILDNSNIVESYPGITLPLTQSFIREAYYQVFRSVLLRLTHEPETVAGLEDILRNMVDTANGRVYYRISNWYDVILFLPFSRKIIPIWQEMLGVKNKEVASHLNKRIGFSTHIRTAFSFVRLLFTCPKLMEQLNGYFREIITDFESVDLVRAENTEILAHYQKLLHKVTEKWDLTLVNDMYAFLFTGLLKSYLRMRKVPNADAEANRCISGQSDIESMKPVRALTELAVLARRQGELSRLKDIHDREGALRYIAAGGVVAEKIAEYLECYGDRNAEELKLESRTFRTNPELLVQKLMQYAEEGVSLNREQYAPATPLRGLGKFLEKRASLGIRNRERSRLYRSRLYGMMRTMMLQVGENLAASGQIPRQSDIFLLTYEEVEQAVAGHREMQEIIGCRREQYRRFESLPAYSRLVFVEKVFDKVPRNVGGMEAAVLADCLVGTACSGGKAQGEVLLVENPTEQVDTAGKILVAKMTDPGWVFLLAGAAGSVG
ncbi:MAG: hypothetical protein K2O34_11005 [Acetatifactor sp.]|nr:hypothetical protein [Acetatifactor sp.]